MLNEYILSKSVRDYYSQIGYEIEPMTAFWIIINNPYKYMDNLTRDLKRLIGETEDVSIEEMCLSLDIVPTFHSLVRYCISLYQDALKRFKSEESNAVYFVYDADDYGNIETGLQGSYSNYQDCIKDLKQRSGNLINGRNAIAYVNGNIQNYLIKKSFPNKYGYSSVLMDRNMKVKKIYEEYDSELGAFMKQIDGLDYDFPTPFKPGDIVREMLFDGCVDNLVVEGMAMGDDGYSKPYVLCDSVVDEFEIVNYPEANHFNLELCDPREMNVLPLTQLTSSYKKGEMQIGDYLYEFKEMYFKNNTVTITGTFCIN